MSVEVDVREIKELLSALNRKMDALMASGETLSAMMLAQMSLREFLDEEPDIYSIDDVKVRYR